MQLEYEAEFPEVISEIKDISIINALTDTQITKALAALESADNSLFVETSDEDGIARKESILGITPLGTDTLAERRYRVALLWYDSVPYTMADLKERLHRLCPDDGYSINMDYANQALTIWLGLSNKKNYAAMSELLEELVPLNISLDCEIRYNRYSNYNGIFTHAQMAAYTHRQLREEVING